MRNSQWIIFPTQSCLVLSFCANLPHSLIMWSLRLYHLISNTCYFVASYLFLLYCSLFFMAFFFSTAIWRDSVSLLRFPCASFSHQHQLVVLFWSLSDHKCHSIPRILLQLCNCWDVLNTSSNHIYPTPPLGQDMTQGQFLSGVSQVWIQSFPSPRLVASPGLKNLVCPTIYP